VKTLERVISQVPIPERFASEATKHPTKKVVLGELHEPPSTRLQAAADPAIVKRVQATLADVFCLPAFPEIE
jgi:hypothetical protein